MCHCNRRLLYRYTATENLRKNEEHAIIESRHDLQTPSRNAALRGEGEAPPLREILLADALLEKQRPRWGRDEVDLVRLGVEPAVAVQPEEAGADPARDPGVVGREEGVVRERQFQLQLHLPLPTPQSGTNCIKIGLPGKSILRD